MEARITSGVPVEMGNAKLKWKKPSLYSDISLTLNCVSLLFLISGGWPVFEGLVKDRPSSFTKRCLKVWVRVTYFCLVTLLSYVDNL
jgi:hypothetical protein